MLKISDAYDFLSNFEAKKLNLFDVKVSCRRWGVPGSFRGIYLGDLADFSNGPLKYAITVEPLFPKTANVIEKTNFLERLTLERIGGDESVPHCSKAISWQIKQISWKKDERRHENVRSWKFREVEA
ncbi:unnamed protein product, partial [Mesorhabditis belari]|uniref:Uncharacterized protein n=1 Tax=Mesorhabditis belari TaxID=2138241 RepID=A0AAF3EQZ9_9BILA